MFPRFVPSAQVGEITNVAWSLLEFIFIGPGNLHELIVNADVTITNIFAPQNLIFQVYVTPANIWYDFISTSVSTNQTATIYNPSVFTTSDPTFWTKARFALQLGGQYFYSAEQTIPL
jgi:hypothetical protein